MLIKKLDDIDVQVIQNETLNQLVKGEVEKVETKINKETRTYKKPWLRTLYSTLSDPLREARKKPQSQSSMTRRPDLVSQMKEKNRNLI